jgi:hypothetical protein
MVDPRYLLASMSFRKPSRRECDKSILERRPPIPFSIDNPRFILTHASCRNPRLRLRYMIKPPVLIYHLSFPGWLNIRSSCPLSRYWFLRPKSHPESVFPRHHRTTKSIDVRSSSQEDTNENIHHVPPIPDMSTKKVTRWDVLALRYDGYEKFKELINSKSCISY